MLAQTAGLVEDREIEEREVKELDKVDTGDA